MLLDGRGPESALAVLFGQVEIDRHRFPDDRSAVVDRGDVAVGIYLQVFRLTRLAGRVDRDVLVLESEFFQRPQSTSGARPRGAIYFYHFDSSTGRLRRLRADVHRRDSIS